MHWRHKRKLMEQMDGVRSVRYSVVAHVIHPPGSPSIFECDKAACEHATKNNVTTQFSFNNVVYTAEPGQKPGEISIDFLDSMRT